MTTSPLALLTAATLALAIALGLCGCSGGRIWFSDNPPAPAISRLDPNVVSDGDNQVPVQLSFVHTSACKDLLVDGGSYEGVTASLVGNPPYVTNGVATIAVTVHPQARIGAHAIALRLSSDNGWGDEISTRTLYVRCNGCPPPPVLVAILGPAGSSFAQIARGTTARVRFRGFNFINDETAVVFLTPGLSADPNAPINIFYDGPYSYFDLPIAVAPNAPTGHSFVQIATSGGTSESAYINVVKQPDHLNPPSAYPRLLRVTPDRLTAGADLFIKCEGDGFGIQRQVITNSTMQVQTLNVVSSQANPDQVVIARVPTFGGGRLKVRVQNLATGLISDDIQIFVEEAAAGQPAARSDDTVAVQRGGDCDLQIHGIFGDERDLLDGTTDTSWIGIPGLTFSGTNVSTTGGMTTVTVHVHADPLAPLTGDEATNLRISNVNGTSNPFLFRIFP